MLKMSSQVETIINAYRTLSKVPSVLGGKLNNNGNKVTSKWSVRNLDKGKSTKYMHNYILDEKFEVVTGSDFGVDVSNELLSAVSPNETFRAVIREEKDSKDAKKQYLEIWSRCTLAQTIDLTALDIHGDVYADSEFGNLDWSHDESAVVYVAEKKLKKSEPYIKRKPEEKNKPDGSGEALPKKGEEFVYRQDWGEQLVGKHFSVIVVCRIETEKFTVLEGLPDSWCPGQIRFTPDGNSVVGVAWETEPRRLGLIFCTNRPSYIFELALDGQLKKLSHDGVSVRSPRFSPRGDMLWLQRAADGPHHACHAIVVKKNNSTEITTLVDIVQTEAKISNGDSFYGVFCLSLPSKGFSKDGKRLLFSTSQQTEVRSYVVDLDGSRIVDISNKSVPQSTTILDVKNDVILATCSNMTTPGQLYVAKLPPQGQEKTIQWIQITKPWNLPASVSNSSVEYLYLQHEGSSDSVKSFSALYMAPSETKKLPLVVWPHGGPHSGFVNAFSLEAALFAVLGFASLQINYRGSSGAGQASIHFLPKRVGDADVKDCKLATDEAIKRYAIDENKLCLIGGSHGGFLVTHLSGQYPDLYKVVATRNPVTDVASLASVRINYRGSTGTGDASCRCLISNIGEYDVKDCHLALTTLIEGDARHVGNVLLYGGSFGGFTIAFLAGKYPEMFKAVVMRNPLIDLATKGHYADNSDGCAVEAGFAFTESGPVSEEQLLAMRRCSPLAHVHKVKAPTALMLGAGDKRVPHYQGLEWARRLKANGVKTRIYMYEDNHSLSSPAAEMDNIINSAIWFFEHLES